MGLVVGFVAFHGVGAMDDEDDAGDDVIPTPPLLLLSPGLIPGLTSPRDAAEELLSLSFFLMGIIIATSTAANRMIKIGINTNRCLRKEPFFRYHECWLEKGNKHAIIMP